MHVIAYVFVKGMVSPTTFTALLCRYLFARRYTLCVWLGINSIFSSAAFAQQSALQPASSQAEGIAILWWSMFYGACLIFFAVMALLAWGLWRARQSDAQLSEVASRNLVIVAGVAIR